jgi:hypothetical protein
VRDSAAATERVEIELRAGRRTTEAPLPASSMPRPTWLSSHLQWIVRLIPPLTLERWLPFRVRRCSPWLSYSACCAMKEACRFLDHRDNWVRGLNLVATGGIADVDECTLPLLLWRRPLL